MNPKLIREASTKAHMELSRLFDMRVSEHLSMVEYLESQKFQYGQVVCVRARSIFDAEFGIDDNSIGVVVDSYTRSGQPNDVGYRIYFNENNPYIGYMEKSLHRLGDDIEIPEHLKTVSAEFFIGPRNKVVFDIKETFK